MSRRRGPRPSAADTHLVLGEAQGTCLAPGLSRGDLDAKGVIERPPGRAGVPGQGLLLVHCRVQDDALGPYQVRNTTQPAASGDRPQRVSRCR